jgi:hypothetical protein
MVYGPWTLKRKNKKKIIAIAAILVSINLTANAQPGSTGGFDDEPQDVPVDGGIILLAAAGAAYGFKKIKKA